MLFVHGSVQKHAKAGLTSAQLAASLAPDEQMSITEFTGEDEINNSDE